MADKHDIGSDADKSLATPAEDRRFLHRVALFDGMVLLFLLALGAIWFAPNVLLLIFACILFAILLYDISSRLQQRLHIPPRLALLLVVALLFGVLVVGGWLMAPTIAQQTNELAGALPNVPNALHRLRTAIADNPLLGALFGLGGVALATPLTAMLTVFVIMLYVQDVLGDPVKTPSKH